MPKNSKSTPTKETDRIAELEEQVKRNQEQLKLQRQKLDAIEHPDGVISTPATNPWHTLPKSPSVTTQAASMGSARTLDLNEEEKEETFSRVMNILDQAPKVKGFIISPKYAEGMSDFIMNLRGGTNDDNDFDSAGYVKTILSVFSSFAGRPLSPAHVDSPALEQLAIVLAAQRVMRVYAEYGYLGNGDKGLTKGDVYWLHPVIHHLQASTIREEFGIPIDVCRRMKMPSPATEPNAYLAVAELNGFTQSVLAAMREQLQRAGLSSHLTTPGLAVTPVIGVDTNSLGIIKSYITANKPPVQTKESIREAVNRFNDDIATDTTEVTSGILKTLHARASELKASLVDYQTQGQSDATDYGIVNDIQLMINSQSMCRALKYNAITVETILPDGHTKYTYRGTSDKILQMVERTLKIHSSDNLIPVTTLVSILPALIASSETEELTAFTDFKATFGKSRARNYRDFILGQHQKVKNDPPRVKGGGGGGGGGGHPSPKPGGGGRGGPGGRGPGPGTTNDGKKVSDPNCQVIVRLNGVHTMRWDEIKQQFAGIVTGLQHVGVPASGDHFYVTFDTRAEAIKAKNLLQGAAWGKFKLTTSLVVPESRANRARSSMRVVLNSTTSSSASDDDDARSTASGYSDALSVAARRASTDAALSDADPGPGLTVTGSALEQLRETLNLSNDTADAVTIMPDGHLRIELAGDGGDEDPEVPP